MQLPPAEPPEQVRVAGHDLTVFVESQPLVDAMVRDILTARRRVWLEVYIFFNDESGRRVAEALKLKAREGLDVRVLFDAIGSGTTPRAFFAEMAAAGVKVHEFHTLLEGLRAMRPLTILNRRDHRKLLVIDDAVGYFGGMNIVDTAENPGPRKGQDRPISSGWRDVHIRLEGPRQPHLAESFERSWRRSRGEPIPKRSRAYRRAVRVTAGGRGEAIHFFDSGPGRRYSRAARVFTRLFRRARRQVTLLMAYFLPTGATLRALLRARRRGVRIRVIVPGQSDVPLVQRATSYLYSRLIRRGLRIYERRQRMLHSKVMVVDDLYTLVGSCNLDPRSLYINLEFLAVIRSEKLAAMMQRVCQFEISQSQRITERRCREVPWHQRLINRLAWSLRWWL